MKVVFLPNYRVSLAERIIPAADLSEQISLAGTEASGTGNMKMMLNGAVTIGTLDGANVEILEEVGEENIFIFGMKAEEVEQRRRSYNPWDMYNSDEEIRRAFTADRKGFLQPFGAGDFQAARPIAARGRRPLHAAGRHARLHPNAGRASMPRIANDDSWDRKAILNVARAGKFSSDRAIKEYATEIWRPTNPCAE